MPKDHRRVRSQSYYRPSPVTTPTTGHYPTVSATQYATISSRPSSLSASSVPHTSYYIPSSTHTMSQQQYPSQHQQQPQLQQNTYQTGGPVQHPHHSVPSSNTYTSIPPNSSPPTSLRPSSGAWSPDNDSTLMAARAQGMNWAPIQQAYFPTKTPNACRKRHERLMERRNADDWDGLKLEQLGRNYMGMRREIWQGLASQVGEKWNVVEQKCMSQGFKNLQQAARSHARRERMSGGGLDTSGNTPSSFNTNGGHGHTHSGSMGGAYTDDSGIGIEDLEAEDYADGAASERSGSSGQSRYGMSDGNGGGYDQRHGGYGGHSSRLPSMDMGIDAIINRPGGGR